MKFQELIQIHQLKNGGCIPNPIIWPCHQRYRKKEKNELNNYSNNIYKIVKSSFRLLTIERGKKIMSKGFFIFKRNWKVFFMLGD